MVFYGRSIFNYLIIPSVIIWLSTTVLAVDASTEEVSEWIAIGGEQIPVHSRNKRFVRGEIVVLFTSRIKKKNPS